jgi:hypothetical protein
MLDKMKGIGDGWQNIHVLILNTWKKFENGTMKYAKCHTYVYFPCYLIIM